MVSKLKCTVLIHTYNEEKNIAGCINSCLPLTNNIVVIDTESTDSTIKIAKKLGAIVYGYKNLGYVEPVRNFGLSKINSEWVLILDADERIGDTLIQKLKAIMSSKSSDIIRIPRQNIILGKWIRYGYWWPDYQVRFFKTRKVTWDSEIHSSPVMHSSKIVDLKSSKAYSIRHVHNKSIKDLVEKYNKYTNYQKYPKLPAKDIYERMFIYPGLEFNKVFFSGDGYKDGIEGYLLAKYMEFYELTKLAKSWEKKKVYNKNKFNELVNMLIEEKEMKEKYKSFSKSRIYYTWEIINKIKRYIWPK